MQIDVVYPYCKSTSYWGNELKYSLRSLCKYLDTLGSVYLIGESSPEWSRDLRVIPERGWVGGARQRNTLISEKLLKACFKGEISDPFIYMCDDFYLLKRTRVEDLSRNYALADLTDAEIPKKLKQGWFSYFWRTVAVLNGRTKRIYNYETHVPKLIHKQSYIDIVTTYGTSHGFNWETLYFNHFFDGQIAEIHDGWVAGVSKKLTQTEILEIIFQPKTHFLNHNDKGLNDDLIEVIRGLFPVRSRFER